MIRSIIPMQVMPDASEIIYYDEVGVPLYIRQGVLSNYPAMRATCHWHEDLEFIHILSGEMCYFVSGERVMLHAGDSLFVNAKQMHYGYAPNGRECFFLCILIHPTLLTANQPLAQGYIRPLISDAAFRYAVYGGDTPEGQRYGGILRQVWQCKADGGFGYQLEAVSLLLSMAAKIAAQHEHFIPDGQADMNPNLTAQKQMVAYIAAHYAEDISLEELAACASVSKSTCERLFKAYIGQTPLQYLNSYRLENSRYLLISSDKPITEIASLCGFNHTSYYGKLFERAYGCSPSAYRKREQAG